MNIQTGAEAYAPTPVFHPVFLFIKFGPIQSKSVWILKQSTINAGAQQRMACRIGM